MVIDVVFNEPAVSQFYYALWDVYCPASVQVFSHPQNVFKWKGVEQVGIKQGLDIITFAAGVQNFPKL
jgi:hypothetical protein